MLAFALDLPDFEAGPVSQALSSVVLLQSLSDLHPPFVLELGDAEQSDAHDGYDDRRDQGKHSFPDILSLAEDVLPEAIERSDECTANDDTKEEACRDSIPYLLDQLLVDLHNEKHSISKCAMRWRNDTIPTTGSRSGPPMLCLRKAKRIDTMIVHSRHSRKQIKNTVTVSACASQMRFADTTPWIPGTANTLTMIATRLCRMSLGAFR